MARLCVRFAAIALLTMFALLTWPKAALAQAGKGNALHVLEIDSDDAEDQAEALTGALRSRVRATPGWTLLETTQSLSMLTAALRCPQRPDATCLNRIADQLKTDRFVWGVMSKGAAHQVTADVHIWIKGKPDQSIKETYSENLKDQNDDTVRKIAGRIFERLTGAAVGTVVVHAGTGAEGGAAAFVDGESRGPLDHGQATLNLPAGPHVIEVRAPGFTTAKQTVNVASGASTEVTLPLASAESSEAKDTGPSKPFPMHKVVGWGAIGAGAVLLAVSAAEFIAYRSAQNDPKVTEYAKTVPNNENVHQSCDRADNPNGAFSAEVCGTIDKAARRDSVLAGVFGGLGAVAVGVGIYFLISDHPAEGSTSEKAANAKPKVRFIPSLSPRQGGLDMRVTF